MDAPNVSIGQELRDQLAAQLEPKRVEIPQPSSGFAESNEAPQEAAPVVPDYDKRMAKVLAQAQRAQAELNSVKTERERLKADLAELERYRELKKIAKEDPVAWAEEGGYKPDEYATLLMEKGSLTPERRALLEAKKELQELKSWRQQQEDAAKQAETRAYHSEVTKHLQAFGKDNPEQFDLVHRTQGYDRVLAKVQEKYVQAMQLGEEAVDPWDFVPEAFASVEAELEEYYRPVLESPKFRSSLAPPTAEQGGPGAPSQQPATRKPSGTINSKMRAQSGPPKQLSEAERLQKAGEALLQQIYARR